MTSEYERNTDDALAEERADETVPEEAEAAADAPTPDDCQAEPPRDDGLNLRGYFRRPIEGGGSEVVELDAGDNAIAAYTANERMTFEGYKAE